MKYGQCYYGYSNYSIPYMTDYFILLLVLLIQCYYRYINYHIPHMIKYFISLLLIYKINNAFNGLSTQKVVDTIKGNHSLWL